MSSDSIDGDDDHIYVTGSDVKNCIFCDRIVYFSRVMHVEPMLGSQQSHARVEHKIEERNEMRRGREKKGKYAKTMHDCPSKIPEVPSLTNGDKLKVKYLNYIVISERLMASAVIDCVLEDEYGRLIPVEYKSMKSRNGRAYSDHVYQVVFYAVLLEDTLQKVSNDGYIHYNDITIRVKITDEMKGYVRRLIGRIRCIIMEERLPPIRVSRRKCNGGCGYRYVCYGY